MSGEETLAQVTREIEHPQLKNLERAGLVIFLYSLLFTSLVSFFAVMIIPDQARPQFFLNLIGGLSMYGVGPVLPKLRLPEHRGDGRAPGLRQGGHRALQQSDRR